MTSHQSIKAHPFNVRNSIILFILVIHIACNAMFLIYDAKNLSDYAESIYLTMLATFGALNFLYVTWKMAEIFRYIANLEDIVSTSKYHIQLKCIPCCVKYFHIFLGLTNSTLKAIYTQTSEKIKKIGGILDFALAKFTPISTTIPAFIASFVAYFTTELGTDAFELPFPTMW